MIGLPHPQRLQVQLDVEIRHERHELPGESDLVGMLRERFPHTLGGDVARVFENLVQAPVFIEKLDGRFWPYARSSWNVVGGVPDQSQVVDYLGRRNAELFVSVTLVHPFGRHTCASASPGVQEVDTGSHELIEILVSGNDYGLESCVSRLDRERADYVIGLVPVQFDEGVVETGYELAHAGQAGPELIGHLLPGRLVLRIELLPVAISGVEDHREIVGLVFVTDIDQEVREAEGGGCVLPLRVGERAANEGEERPVDQCVGIDKEETGRLLRWDVHRLGPQITELSGLETHRRTNLDNPGTRGHMVPSKKNALRIFSIRGRPHPL